MWTPLGFRFAQPEWLWGLPALCIFVALRFIIVRRVTGGSLRYSFIDGMAGLPRSIWLRISWLPAVLRFLVLALLIVGLARPQFGFKKESIETFGVDIMLAVDLSGSMEQDDLKPNRLAIAKHNMTKFVEGRPSDNFGIVGFAEVAALLCPLTPEYDIIRQFIERLDFRLLGENTALGDAIALATLQLDKSDADSKVLILLTDGKRTAGEWDPKSAAESAAALGIRMYTIGIGTKSMRRGYSLLSMAPADFEPELLREMARMTGGAYFHAADSNRFEEIFEEIDRLERTRREHITNRQYDERMEWFIFPAFALFLLELLLSRTRLRRLP